MSAITKCLSNLVKSWTDARLAAELTRSGRWAEARKIILTGLEKGTV